MTPAQRFIVGFRGDLSGDEEYALRGAGFGVYRDGAGSPAARWGGGADWDDWRSRHVVTNVEAAGPDEALERVRQVLGRDLEDPIVAPEPD